MFVRHKRAPLELVIPTITSVLAVLGAVKVWPGHGGDEAFGMRVTSAALAVTPTRLAYATPPAADPARAEMRA